MGDSETDFDKFLSSGLDWRKFCGTNIVKRQKLEKCSKTSKGGQGVWDNVWGSRSFNKDFVKIFEILDFLFVFFPFSGGGYSGDRFSVSV